MFFVIDFYCFKFYQIVYNYILIKDPASALDFFHRIFAQLIIFDLHPYKL